MRLEHVVDLVAMFCIVLMLKLINHLEHRHGAIDWHNIVRAFLRKD